MKSVVLIAFLLFTSALGLEDERGARVIAAYSTRTVITLTTITSEQPLTCANFSGANNCQKRRFRRYRNLDRDFGGEDESALLDSSLLEGEASSVKEDKREGRIALTVWSSSTSTFTVTSTSVNSSTTFSLSFFCTAAGASFPPAC